MPGGGSQKQVDAFVIENILITTRLQLKSLWYKFYPIGLKTPFTVHLKKKSLHEVFLTCVTFFMAHSVSTVQGIMSL